MPVATLAAGEVQLLQTLDDKDEWDARKALLRVAAPRLPLAPDGPTPAEAEA